MLIDRNDQAWQNVTVCDTLLDSLPLQFTAYCTVYNWCNRTYGAGRLHPGLPIDLHRKGFTGSAREEQENMDKAAESNQSL